jgi:hypothetical protein
MAKAWGLGFLFSLVLGGIVTWVFVALLRWWMGTPPKALFKKGAKAVPAVLTGLMERLFFTVLVGLDTPAVPAYMLTWLGLKMATNWNHPDWKDKPDARAYALSALLGGLVSMLFALLGGLITKKLLADS